MSVSVLDVYRQEALKSSIFSEIPRYGTRRANCSHLHALNGLTALLAKPLQKLKFLLATERFIESSGGAFCNGAGARLIDVGAGGGEFTRWISGRCGLCSRAYDVWVGSNTYSTLSQNGHGPIVRALKANHTRDFKVHLFDGAHLPEATASADLVIFNSILHHAHNNSCILLSEARRVLSPPRPHEAAPPSAAPPSAAPPSAHPAGDRAGGHMLVFEDLAVDATIVEHDAVGKRHHLHDPRGQFRTNATWRAMFAAAGFRIRGEVPVGSRALSHAHGTWTARLDHLYQHAFWLQVAVDDSIDASARDETSPEVAAAARARACEAAAEVASSRRQTDQTG